MSKGLIAQALEKSWVDEGHRYIWENGKNMPFAHFIWNLFAPQDPIIRGDGFLIHHKDLNPLNDDICNLQKITRPEHQSIHKAGKKLSDEHRKKLSISHKGYCHTQQQREKMSIAMKGRVISKEWGDKISQANKGRKLTDEHKKKLSIARKGKEPWNKGKTGVYSKETLLKIRESGKGRSPWNKNISYKGEVRTT